MLASIFSKIQFYFNHNNNLNSSPSLSTLRFVAHHYGGWAYSQIYLDEENTWNFLLWVFLSGWLLYHVLGFALFW